MASGMRLVLAASKYKIGMHQDMSYTIAHDSHLQLHLLSRLQTGALFHKKNQSFTRHLLHPCKHRLSAPSSSRMLFHSNSFPFLSSFPSRPQLVWRRRALSLNFFSHVPFFFFSCSFPRQLARLAAGGPSASEVLQFRMGAHIPTAKRGLVSCLLSCCALP
jgi:hypothetical protein